MYSKNNPLFNQIFMDELFNNDYINNKIADAVYKLSIMENDNYYYKDDFQLLQKIQKLVILKDTDLNYGNNHIITYLLDNHLGYNL